VEETVADWFRLRWADLHFDAAWTAVLVLVVLAAICLLILVARGLRSRNPGRTHIALPAVLPLMRTSYFTSIRHAAFLMFLIGIPFFAIALADPRTAFTREETSYPGRRIALLVDGSSSMGGRRCRAFHAAAEKWAVSRSHRAHSVRE
jgi:hypothetical protein